MDAQLARHLENKEKTFKKLADTIKSVPANVKANCPEEWVVIDSYVAALKPMLGQVTELKFIVAISDGITAFREAIQAKHMNFKGTTSRVGTRTRFGQQLEDIRIAALNLQYVVPDDGDIITLQLIDTLALIAEKTPKTAKI